MCPDLLALNPNVVGFGLVACIMLCLLTIMSYSLCLVYIVLCTFINALWDSLLKIVSVLYGFGVLGFHVMN